MFKVGDKVRRISGLADDAWPNYTSPKDPFGVYTVTDVRGVGYDVLTDANRYWWSSEYFEVVSQDINEYI